MNLDKEKKLLELRNKIIERYYPQKQLFEKFVEFKNELDDFKNPKLLENLESILASLTLIFKQFEKNERIEIDWGKIPKIRMDNSVKVDWERMPRSLQIDWDKMPKIEKIDFKSPLENLFESIKKFFAPFVEKIILLLSEPDKIEITDEGYNEYYGKKKVSYKIIRRNDKIKEIIRNET